MHLASKSIKNRLVMIDETAVATSASFKRRLNDNLYEKSFLALYIVTVFSLNFIYLYK